MESDSGQTAPRPLPLDPERLLVAILALGTFAALFLLRAADDNRLTSWRWVFAGVDPARLFALVLASIAVAHLAASMRVPRRAVPAILFFSAFAAAACFWPAPEVIVDAARYFTEAKDVEVHGLRHFLSHWGDEVPAWTDLPLVPLLYGIVLAVTGESRVHLQAFATLLFAGSAVVTWRLGKALWDDEAGLAAGALLLAAPYLLTQAPAVLVDVPTLFFVTLAVLATTRAVQEGGAARVAIASTAVALALLSKYSAWLLLSVLPVIGVALRRTRPGALRTLAAVALGAGLLVASALLPWRHVVAGQLGLLASYQAPGLRRWGESFASTFLFQLHPFLTAAALASVAVAVRRRDPRYAIVAWPVLLLAALRIERARYWIPALPFLALMAGYGLRAIPRPALRRQVVACAVATSLAVSVFGYLPFLRRTSAANLMAAGAYLDAIDEPRAEVVALAGPDPVVNPSISVPLLDLYTRKRLVHRGEPVTAAARDRARASSLRFTWEYRDPPYYDGSAADVDRGAALVIVTDDLGRPLPPAVAARLAGRRLAREFAADEGVFEHRTLVRVYRAEGAAPTGGPRP